MENEQSNKPLYLEKNYMLQNLTIGSYLSWQINSNSPSSVIVELTGNNGGTYFSENVSNQVIQIPNAQGADICHDTEMSLKLTSEKKLNLKLTSHDMLSESGEVKGRVYHYNGLVAENQDEEIQIVIIAWNNNHKTLSLSEKEFIAECFYKYLSEKSNYLFNYISDGFVKECYDELDSINKSSKDYQSWYNNKIKSTKSALEHYKLIFALLLNYDKNCSVSDPLEYFIYKNIVMVFGKKQWNEEKLTVGSCPFQNIRGIILNSTELEAFKGAYNKLRSITLFSKGQIKAAASYANISSKLEIKANRGLNFSNIGLEVSANTEQQTNVITNSVSKADSGKASILIFPELSINKNSLSCLEDSLSTTSNLNLVIAGSHYEGTSGSIYKNVSAIYAKVNGNWENVANYTKLIPFTMGYSTSVAKTYKFDTEKYPLSKYKLLVEDIEMNDNITLLPYKDCVIGIAICRDALDLLDSHNPLHKYCDFTDIMLVISDNAGDSNMFVGTAECLARWHNCATIYTNSIHEAIGIDNKTDNYLEISFGIYPFKDSNTSSSTSVSGEINYIDKPFQSANIVPNTVGILYSKGIKYSTVKKDEYCKIYELIAAK